MNNINGMNNINFGAKMNISKVTNNKARWENIARIFEERTQKQPNITFNVVESSELNGILAEAEGAKDKFYHPNFMVYAEFLDEGFNELMNLADNVIASKFKLLMNLATKNDSIYQKTSQQAKNMKLGQRATEKMMENAIIQTFDDTQTVLIKDEFLKDKFITIA